MTPIPEADHLLRMVRYLASNKPPGSGSVATKCGRCSRSWDTVQEAWACHEAHLTVKCWAVINDNNIPVQCYATRELAERHLAGNFNTPNWRVAHLSE